MQPTDLSIKDFTYTLPEEKIAHYPLAQRDDSKLLIYHQHKLKDDYFKNIYQYIPTNSLLIFNNTKVVAARLLFKKITGSVIEIFCLEPHEQYADITTALSQKGKVYWQCLIGGVSKWKNGQVLEKKIEIDHREIIIKATYQEKRSETFIIELSWNDATVSFSEILHYAGATPLPPYIKRSSEVSDIERYQTIYAQLDGSVAAPTAGLHFTDSIFTQLKDKNILTDFITLHVGAGTFKPVKVETLQEHEMHAEYIEVSKTAIENILLHINNNIIGVGTTSARTMESLYWLGVKKSGVLSLPAGQAGQEPACPAGRSGVVSESSLSLSQWEAYELEEKNIPVKDALQSLLNWMQANKLETLHAKTQLLIAPGYRFKIIKGLITNFHQPQSTLLLLVAALLGKNVQTEKEGWKEVYDYALQNDFRFLSYGDGSLLWRHTH